MPSVTNTFATTVTVLTNMGSFTDFDSRWRLLAFAMLCGVGLSGCASGKSELYSASKAPPPKGVSIAVRQFSTPKYATLSDGDRGVRDFEHFYLPAEIVTSLSKRSNVSAFYTMESSPATDFVVNGYIGKSDGRFLSLNISMMRVDGKKVLSRTFSINHDDARERVLVPRMRQFYDGIAATLAAQAFSTNINLNEARAKAYAENPRLPIQDKTLENGLVAGQIERESILTPLTSHLLPRAQIASKVYLQWQVVSIPLQKDKELASHEQSMAAAGSALALVTGAASVAQSYQFAQQGNQQGMQMARQNLDRAQHMLINTTTAGQAAANRKQEIIKSLAAYGNQFATGTPRQVTVRIYDKIVTLRGSQAEMLQEFRKLVKDELNASEAD